MTRLLSNTPDGPSAGLPPVTVCAAESTLIHSTVSPALIVTSAGDQHSLVSSHPGTEVPTGISTWTVVGHAGSSIIGSSSTSIVGPAVAVALTE